MRRPSRRPNFGKTPWVWSHGDGLGRDVDPTCNPESACLTEADYAPLEEINILECEFEWRRLDNNHRLKEHNRAYHSAGASSSAGQPAAQAEVVDPTKAATREDDGDDEEPIGRKGPWAEAEDIDPHGPWDKEKKDNNTCFSKS